MPEAPSLNESRIRALTKLYYANPAVQKAMMDFARNREVVPRYFEGFGKRPDCLLYPSDIQSLVQRGATSFHSSQEVWTDPLQINSDMRLEELSALRQSWDLLIDIDSPYLDYSKIAAHLVCDTLEKYGVMNYGIKFSGSKGFHIIVSSNSFPESYEDKDTKTMFPEWPRAITEFILNEIRGEYNRRITQLGVDFKALERRMNVKKEEILEIAPCPNCNGKVRKSPVVFMKCPKCGTSYTKPDYKATARKIKCTNNLCSGFFDVIETQSHFFCNDCKFNSLNKKDWEPSTGGKVIHNVQNNFSEEFKEELSGDKLGSLDLVLVSSRHLFRMPYSLHEKTSLASAVINKSQITTFAPKDADPLRVAIRDYYPAGVKGEATRLLEYSLAKKKSKDQEEEKKYQAYKEYEKVNFSGVTDDMFPAPIKKLLKGLNEGRKRGLFILLTFLRSLDFSPEAIISRIHEWNKRNDPPLKEGYIKSQIDWHLKQKRKILPPNYDNPSFYKDLNLLDKEPTVKNPIVEVTRNLRKNNA